MSSPEQRCQRILEPLARARDEAYIGEPVSQLQHALQAADLAWRGRGSVTLALAALLHDLGHLLDPEAPQMEGLGTLHHERLGADWLRQQGCSEELCALVAGHVDAKRYLVATSTRYAGRLSEASQGTLAFQGGPMGEEERRGFALRSDREALLFLRRCDEAAKEPDAQPPGLEFWRPLLLAHLQEQGARR